MALLPSSVPTTNRLIQDLMSLQRGSDLHSRLDERRTSTSSLTLFFEASNASVSAIAPERQQLLSLTNLLVCWKMDAE